MEKMRAKRAENFLEMSHCRRDALSIKVKEGLSWIHKSLQCWIHRKMQKSFKKTSGSISTHGRRNFC